MPERSPSPRRRRLVRGALASAVLLGIAGYALVQHEADVTGPPRCTVAGEDGEVAYTLLPAQAANAATIGAVGSARGLPERAITIALATAMQESSLRNIDYGDRDSLGLFQQRPSMGWGTEEQIMDPVYSAGVFYDRLVEIPDYLDMPLTEAAQEVQRSAFPDEYAKHEPRMALLAAALTGRAAEALTCTVAQEPVPGDPVAVQQRMIREFGEGVEPATDGAAVTVPVQPAGESRRGWELAHWAVAHSGELGIERISYGDRIWESERSDDGWRRTEPEGGAVADDGAGGDGGQAELQLALFEGE